jgi:predicted nucleic acid-binding protein
MESTDERLLYLSVLTLGEIRKGVAALPQGRKRTTLESWLDVDLQVRFARKILPIDAGVADRWGLIVSEAKIRGKSLPVIDSLLAATALHHNLTVVSRNISDFVLSKVPVLNPWES